ncbi:hypothetical protein A2870_02025 [Candidatus Curtissbacteria bacterium RIFCSPHIGHO2_01_FULL_41_11]|uniref:Uncharacterized protein n=1 Tax=Candidatus Curtissbacteria bacterium RIFCSPHIGHO2_01_FULL_41_11 TaxID=1797711 RepID=A0A1F5G3V9_9BACT|nr:MAG: hypothetical protein A2870_02025 [Candidatus Curtissbacteria bacterium RIFCSPHIGHO2_01_FULL_41_11]
MAYLKFLWKKWLLVAHAIGNFQAQVILSVFYFILIFPLGIVFRFFSDPLHLKFSKDGGRKTSFEKWEHSRESLEEAHRQY